MLGNGSAPHTTEFYARRGRHGPLLCPSPRGSTEVLGEPLKTVERGNHSPPGPASRTARPRAVRCRCCWPPRADCALANFLFISPFSPSPAHPLFALRGSLCQPALIAYAVSYFCFIYLFHCARPRSEQSTYPDRAEAQPPPFLFPPAPVSLELLRTLALPSSSFLVPWSRH